jgi:hypothetical protein
MGDKEDVLKSRRMKEIEDDFLRRERGDQRNGILKKTRLSAKTMGKRNIT